MDKIVAIIVTYNRKQLLSICLDAIVNQALKPVVAYIIDNASTDGTDEWVHENGFDGVKSGIEFRYISRRKYRRFWWVLHRNEDGV